MLTEIPYRSGAAMVKPLRRKCDSEPQTCVSAQYDCFTYPHIYLCIKPLQSWHDV